MIFRRFTFVFSYICLAVSTGLAAPSFFADEPVVLGQEAGVEQSPPQSADSWVKEGDAFGLQKEFDEAENAYREALRLDPGNEPAYLKLGALLLAVGRRDEGIALLYSARQSLKDPVNATRLLMGFMIQAGRLEDFVKIGEEYLESRPNDTQVLSDIGRAYIDLRQFDNAIAVLREAVLKDDTLSSCWVYLGFAYRETGRYDDALAALRKAVALESGSPNRSQLWVLCMEMLLRTGRMDELLTEVDRELAANPESAEAFFVRGTAYMNQHKFDAAIEDWQKAVEIENDPALKGTLYLELASAYHQTSRYSEAIDMANEALEWLPDEERNKPRRFVAYKLLASAYTMASRCEESMAAFEKAVEIRNDDLQLYNNQSQCLAILGRENEAESFLRFVLQKSPDNFEARCNLATLLLQRKRFAESEPEFRSCLKLKDDDWRLYLNFGILLQNRGKWTESVAAYRQALRLKPGDAVIMNNLAYAMLELNENTGEAVQLLENAVRTSPSSPHIHDSLGWAYFKAGKYSEAEPELLIAARGMPDSAVVFEHLGDVCAALGKRADALNNWKKSLLLTDDREIKSRLRSKIDAKQPSDTHFE